jgi:hypothetical protein
MNGCMEVTDVSIIKIAEYYPNLKNLEISWNRNITDTSMIILAECCPNLEYIGLLKCPNITDLSMNMFQLEVMYVRKIVTYTLISRTDFYDEATDK